MKLLLCIFLVLCLSGCGSILDPAPYSPLTDLSLTDDAGKPIAGQKLVHYSDPADANIKLLAMSIGYSKARDEISRQQLAFDVPAIGLGVASLVSVSFHGALSATTGLALGGAGLYGAKTYFEPGTKIAAYNSAAQALGCAASSAGSLDQASGIYKTSAINVQTNLQTDGDTATTLLTGSATLTSTTKTALLSARDSATTALASLTAALSALQSVTANMQIFALSTVNKTTTTIVNGTPSPAAVLATIKAGIIPTATPVTPPTSKPAAVPEVHAANGAAAAAAAEANAQLLISELNTDVLNAAVDSKGINDALATFTACTTSP